MHCESYRTKHEIGFEIFFAFLKKPLANTQTMLYNNNVKDGTHPTDKKGGTR